MPDADGYPVEDELIRIGAWEDSHDCLGWLALVKSCWWAADWGWRESLTDEGTLRQFDVSTGGWSGNESIITTMQSNFVMWAATWDSRRRGGHFVFLVPVA